MGVKPYTVETSSGVTKKLYLVIAEGINRYTGTRIQKKRRGITSEVKAQRIYRELWSLCREERPDGPPIKKFGELKEGYLTYINANIRTATNPNGFSPQVEVSKRSRLSHLKHWDEHHLDLITPHFVTSELNKMESCGQASRSLTADIQKEVKCLFTYAVERGFFKISPLAILRKRKLPKKKKEALTHGEVNTLLTEAHKRNHSYFFIWLLTLTLGLRRSELAGLKWTDIDFENGLIHLTRQLQPKEGLVHKLKDNEDRTVAIPSSVTPVFKRYYLKSSSDFVIDVDCKMWKQGHQAEVLRAFCRLIGIKEVTHHQLRATHITLALIDGVPLGIVKENVGHAKLSTTDEYFRSSGIQMSGKTDKLSINVPTGLDADVLPLRSK